jgi:DNA-binding transcriptional ArsR family regulator
MEPATAGQSRRHLEERTLLAQDQALRLGQREVLAPLGIGLDPRAVGFVSGEAVEGVGEPARAEMLTALMGGQALTATELAQVAGVTKQTVSAHLAKLLDARLLAVESQGRHRYFRLADRDVAQLLESLMGVAYRAGAVRSAACCGCPAKAA